jgi:NAD(P)-dependent dehydrogenase (short-subunit alcohol dehydrogenase family)
MSFLTLAAKIDCARSRQRIEKHGGKATIVVGDVTDDGISDRMLDEADQRFGGFYAVFANAGYGMNKPVHEMSEEETRQMFEVNFFAALDLINKAAHRLIERKQPGHLLDVFELPGEVFHAHARSLCRDEGSTVSGLLGDARRAEAVRH